MATTTEKEKRGTQKKKKKKPEPKTTNFARTKTCPLFPLSFGVFFLSQRCLTGFRRRRRLKGETDRQIVPTTGKGEKTEYKLEEGKLSSTTPLESQVHERLSLLLALEEEEEEGMLVDREGGEDVIGSENYFEGKVLILFLPPFHSRNKKTEEGEGGKRNMLLQLAFLGSLKEGEDTGREGKNHHCILMFVTIKILYTK